MNNKINNNLNKNKSTGIKWGTRKPQLISTIVNHRGSTKNLEKKVANIKSPNGNKLGSINAKIILRNFNGYV